MTSLNTTVKSNHRFKTVEQSQRLSICIAGEEVGLLVHLLPHIYNQLLMANVCKHKSKNA